MWFRQNLVRTALNLHVLDITIVMKKPSVYTTILRRVPAVSLIPERCWACAWTSRNKTIQEKSFRRQGYAAWVFKKIRRHNILGHISFENYKQKMWRITHLAGKWYLFKPNAKMLWSYASYVCSRPGVLLWLFLVIWLFTLTLSYSVVQRLGWSRNQYWILTPKIWSQTTYNYE